MLPWVLWKLKPRQWRKECVLLGIMASVQLIFEGDSMVVHNSLTGSITSLANICNLICDNKVAHGLAQHAKSLFESVIWLETCPPFVEHLVTSDVMFSSS